LEQKRQIRKNILFFYLKELEKKGLPFYNKNKKKRKNVFFVRST